MRDSSVVFPKELWKRISLHNENILFTWKWGKKCLRKNLYHGGASEMKQQRKKKKRYISSLIIDIFNYERLRFIRVAISDSSPAVWFSTHLLSHWFETANNGSFFVEYRFMEEFSFELQIVNEAMKKSKLSTTLLFRFC